MPLQNRVTPFGEIIAVADRGMFMGNRGILHDSQRRIVRQHTKSKAWIICRTVFKGRKRELMTPRRYTELFFLDEATALAAGHRPCGECRRLEFQQFRAAWLTTMPISERGVKPGISELDDLLQNERLTSEGKKRTYQVELGELPDGVFVRLKGFDDAFLWWRNRLLRWTAGGYKGALAWDKNEAVEVLTPPITVRVLRAGYKPELHESAHAWR
jgi:hypothetical protein